MKIAVTNQLHKTPFRALFATVGHTESATRHLASIFEARSGEYDIYDLALVGEALVAPKKESEDE